MTFLESVKAQVKILRAEEVSILQQIAPLQKELEQLRAQIAHLEGYLTALNPSKPGDIIEEKESITKKIIRVFEREKRPLHYMEVLDLLEKHEGFIMPGKDPKANMTAKLSGSPKFKRVNRGVYILSEWADHEKVTSRPA